MQPRQDGWLRRLRRVVLRQLARSSKQREVKRIWIFLLGFAVVSGLWLAQRVPSPSAVGSVETQVSPQPDRSGCALFDTPTKSRRLAFGNLAPLFKLEHALNAGWNFTDRPTRVLVIGKAGYVKRDYPVYENAFLSKALQSVYPTSSHQTVLTTTTAHDVVLCLAFNTDDCLNSADFFSLTKRINRIQSLREVVWSKDHFCHTMSDALSGYVPHSLVPFTFDCWVLPEEYDSLVRDSKRKRLSRWISKPRALGAGMGIKVINDLSDIKRSSKHVVQAYLTNPLLVQVGGSQRKWDMR